MSDSEEMPAEVLTRTVPELNAAGAQRAVAVAVAAAGQLDVGIVVFVVDRGGNPLAMLRMDGAPRFSVEVAHKKAWTAASSGSRTDVLRDVINGDPTLLHGLQGGVDMLMAVGGATPILVDGELAGAVGVSGATEEQDQQIADAATASIDARSTTDRPGG